MKKNRILIGIFIAAIIVRFLWFQQSTYFGFDEARDAFISQAIFKNGDFKLIGPPANAPGLNHGVLHWYLLGFMYLVGGGNPLFVSALFRLINAAGVVLLYLIGSKLFNKKTGLIAAVIFAFSFEATQYAMYTGNPSLAVLSWMAIFLGAAIIYKNKNKFWGLPLIALGIASGAQLELFLVTLFGPAVLSLIVLFKETKKINWRSWLTAIAVGVSVASPYILGELKNGFRSVKAAMALVNQGYSVMGNTETKWDVYFKRFVLMFHDNIGPLPNTALKVIAVALVVFLVIKAVKSVGARLVLIWMFGGLFVLIFGAYNAYYINVGIGSGIILGMAVLIATTLERSKYLAFVLLALVIVGNLRSISINNPNGLIEDIKTQQFMTLNYETEVVNKLYELAGGRAFTIRTTSMPYRMQTVWAYLLNQYGQSKHHYLPYLETGNVLGYPGWLPQPTHGTTCVRFLVREPIGGIPSHLVKKDVDDENEFSTVKREYQIGRFLIQERQSRNSDCHNDKPII